MKRVLSLQDMSCFGKCSLTLTIPIVSAMGVECVPVPTAVLSAHTGGLGEVVFEDLRENILPVLGHLERIGAEFDVIHIGYLGGEKHIDIARRAAEMFGRGAKVLLDPVMGDNGALYKGFGAAYAEKMRSLVPLADYVLPNITEAALLAGVNYEEEPVSGGYLKNLFRVLSERFDARFIITGVGGRDKKTVGAASFYPGAEDIYYTVGRAERNFHGTGDVFASVMAGSAAKGLSLKESVRKSVDFTAAVIKETAAAGTDERFGVHFEKCLRLLWDGE